MAAVGPREQISATQGALLVMNTILPTAVLFLPAISAAQAKEDAWLSPLAAMLAAMGMAWIHTALALRFPGQSLIQIAPRIVGRWLGKLVGLAYLWWWLHIDAIIIREFAEFMLTAVLPTTPISAFVLVMLVLCAYAIRHGIEVLARANQVIVGVMVLGLGLLMVLVAPKWKGENLLPILGRGILPVLRGAWAPASWMGEVVTATMMIFPFLANPGQARLVVFGGLAATAAVLSLVAVSTLGVLGAHTAAVSKLPTLTLARMIEVAAFLERLDPIFDAIWVMGNFVKISIFYYAFCRGTAEWLGLQDYRPLVLPTLTLYAPLSVLLYENVSQLSAWLAKTWPPYAILVFEFGLPAVLLAVAALRGRDGFSFHSPLDSPASGVRK